MKKLIIKVEKANNKIYFERLNWYYLYGDKTRVVGLVGNFAIKCFNQNFDPNKNFTQQELNNYKFQIFSNISHLSNHLIEI